MLEIFDLGGKRGLTITISIDVLMMPEVRCGPVSRVPHAQTQCRCEVVTRDSHAQVTIPTLGFQVYRC